MVVSDNFTNSFKIIIKRKKLILYKLSVKTYILIEGN